MSFYEELTDEQVLSTAINTYRVVILNHDYNDIFDESPDSPMFYIDVVDLYNNSVEDIADAVWHCLKIFEDYEHYEKCYDIINFIKNLKNEI